MASTGPNSPGTTADDATVGTLGWSNTDEAKTSNNVYASVLLATGTSHYLKCTNFGFNIPYSTINGIVVEIEKYRGGGTSVYDSELKLVKGNGTIGTTNKADTTTNWVTADPNTYVSYGSSTDNWSENLSSDDVNNSNFGVVLSILADGSSSANVDHIRITVYYSAIPSYTIGQQEIQTNYPVVQGLEADEKHDGQENNLTPQEATLLMDYEKVMI